MALSCFLFRLYINEYRVPHFLLPMARAVPRLILTKLSSVESKSSSIIEGSIKKHRRRDSQRGQIAIMKDDLEARESSTGAKNAPNSMQAPRFIRTLGSQSLGGLRGNNSQRSSVSPPYEHGDDSKESSAVPQALLMNSSGPNSHRDSTCSPAGPRNYRVAQACDRCRSKKTRCDGKRPQCSQCAAVGFECKISDRLSRRAFPRGYTETLEERVRELEAENRRLVALCDIKEQQIHLFSQQHSPGGRRKDDERMLRELQSANGGSLNVSSTNLYLLNASPHTTQQQHLKKQPHVCDGVCCEGKLHVKPVSTNLNDPTSVSFEQSEAPGLPAVQALTSVATREQSNQLATLVALSVPRSTEEILFIPQLLARIRQIYGFTSKQCLYTVSLLSSLKSSLPEPQLMDYEPLERLEAVNLWEMDDLEQFFGRMLKFQFGAQHGEEPGLSIGEVEELVSLFFEQWSVHIPILVKEGFYRYFGQFKENVLHSLQLLKTPLQGPALAARRDKIISYKIFGCLLLMLCQMGLLTKTKSDRLVASHKYHRLASYYHRAVSLAYMNPYFGVFSTSLQSLQFLSLVLFYFLNVGNISAIYDLRGRVVSMAQQLRLHRCPSAVLGGAGSTMDKREQGDRRVLFWGIYYLDVFSALQLGVPRLIKDFEIECALPVSDNDDRTVNLAGQQIRLEGRVTQFSLAIIRFAKVLGNILDSIFKRGMTESITKQVSLIHENALDNWRRGLPQELMFELDVNGTINMDEFNKLKQMNATVEHSENIVLLVMYFLAKCMIHLPVVATRPLPTNEPGESNDTTAAASAAASSGHTEARESSSEVSQAERSSSSYVLLQQATNTLLNVLESLKTIYLPMPLNISRTKARFALLSARGSLEYIKGGALFLDNKALLLNVIQDLEEDRKLELPGIISWNSLKLLDMSINLLLQPPNTEVEKLDKLLKKKLNHYNRLMGRPIVKSEQSSRAANLTPASSKGDEDTPPAKRVKIEEPVMPPPLNHEQASQEQHESHPQQPVSTQTAFAEALQLDPVLNGNSFGGHGLNPTLYDMPQHHSNHPQMQEPQLNAQSSDKLHGLFKVPSTADLLMDDPANSQLNMLLNTGELGGPDPIQPSTFTNLNSGFSGLNLSNLFGLEGSAAQGGATMGSGQRQQPDTGFNFAVDASLGLAPLLAWTPDRNSIVLDPMNEGEDLHSDQHQTALPPHQQQLHQQQQQQQQSEEQQPQESEEDLSMRKRSHRSRGRGRPRKHEENLHDLFCWQNSK
ncbi:CAT8 (YMR280C) [Zygosaccharomyces parabailii]|nr:CAT8 (YMR280C) [Zygosaccharomyces parabailii]